MKILLATDGSLYSEAATRFLTHMELSSDDTAMVLHSVYWVPFMYDMESYYVNLAEIKKELAPRIIDSAIEILSPLKASISTAIVDGSPERYILETAKESGADLIVMGARGIKGLTAAILGSVTKVVGLKAEVPVLVVKAPERAVPTDMDVLFATDGSEHAAKAADCLVRMPLSVTSEITTIHVVRSSFADIPDRFAAEVNDRMKTELAAIRAAEFSNAETVLEAARSVIATKYRAVRGITKVGDPAEEILKTADELGSHLIVIGCRGMKGIASMMGSVSRNVLTHSNCSVLICRSCV